MRPKEVYINVERVNAYILNLENVNYAPNVLVKEANIKKKILKFV
jgi:hypothetical protein